MQAVKGNKVYTIGESEKARYISMGYDILEGEEVVAYGKGKTVSYSEYEKVLKENAALKEELDSLKQETSDPDETDKKSTKKSTQKE